jgi:hypothetical protein
MEELVAIFRRDVKGAQLAGVAFFLENTTRGLG